MRNMKWVRMLSLILCLMFLLCTLTSCKKNEEGTSGEEKSDLLEFEFYRDYSWDVGKYEFDETNLISKWVIDNKKVKVNFTWPGGSAEDKFNLMVASNTLPEVIMIPRDSTWLNLISSDGLSDKILPLDEFYYKYEGYRTNVDAATVDFTRVNGKIYGMLNWPKQGEWMGYGTGLVINKKIYEELGSPDISTLDGLYEYLKMVKAADPSIVPFQPASGEVTFGLLWCCYGDGRIPEDTYGIMRKDVDGKLVHIINDPRFPEFISFLRKLYKEALISPEYSIEMAEPIMTKLKKQKVAVFCGVDGINVADSARSVLEAAGRENPYDCVPLPAAPGTDPATIVSGQSSAVGWNVICLTQNANYENGVYVEGRAEAIYAYLDWVFSNEGQRLMLCGPEGELWEGLDENDFPIFKEGKSLNLTSDEMKRIPVGNFMYPGNASYVDSLKNDLFGKLDPSELSWTNIQQMKFANQLREATEFTGIESIEDMEISQIYVRADDYWKGKMVELVVSDDDIDTMLATIKTDLYGSYQYGRYEEYATNVWKENRVKMNLD